MAEKNNFTQFSRKISSICLFLLTLNLKDIQSTEVNINEHLKLEAKVDALSQSVQQALIKSGQNLDQLSDQEIEKMVESTLDTLASDGEQIGNQLQDQKKGQGNKEVKEKDDKDSTPKSADKKKKKHKKHSHKKKKSHAKKRKEREAKKAKKEAEKKAKREAKEAKKAERKAKKDAEKAEKKAKKQAEKAEKKAKKEAEKKAQKDQQKGQSQKPKEKSSPANFQMLATKQQGILLENSQPVLIPIDDLEGISLTIAPTSNIRDAVESVTLKSFRKVIGYDTFSSILKKNVDEKKLTADHYNVTISIMVRRDPKPIALSGDPFQNTTGLSASLDKGFPYDDGDNSIDDQAEGYAKKKFVNPSTIIGTLNDFNYTKQNLVNLIENIDPPITQSLVQIDQQMNLKKGDSSCSQNSVKFNNQALSQESNNQSSSFVELNKTKQLTFTSNIQVDQPRQILSQKNLSNADSGVPVLVNPTLMKNEMADAKLNLTMRVLGDIIQVSKQNEKSKEEQIHQKEFPISVHI